MLKSDKEKTLKKREVIMADGRRKLYYFSFEPAACSGENKSAEKKSCCCGEGKNTSE
jgi:hypothetical protein